VGEAAYYDLSPHEVAIAAAMIVVSAGVSIGLRLGLERRLLWAGVRTVAQLILVGFALEWIFAASHPIAIGAVVAAMTIIAGVAAVGRTGYRFPGIYLSSITAVLLSSWLVTAAALAAVVPPSGWSERPAQYVIPLVGMLLGNALTGIALGLDRFAEGLANRRGEIELRLSVGATRWEAARPLIREAVRTGMIPIINAMMVVGLVSLPGMMTGQLLAGVSPLSAVEYQIAIMFLIAATTSLGTIGVVLLGYRRLFSDRHQLRADLLDRA
jgi:putative ABC transport system permease protein